MVIFEKAAKSVKVARIQTFARRAQKLARVDGEVSVLITGSARMRELNRRFRRKNKPTDVLSFPRPEGGDIAISLEIASENAARYGHELEDELKILVLHGLLHLAGHDHELDNGEMARLEQKLRSRLGLHDSLIARSRTLVRNASDARFRPSSSHETSRSRSSR